MSEEILVPIDFSDVTDGLLREAARLARAFGMKLTLLHVASPQPDFIGYEVGPVYIRQSVAEQLHKQHAELQEYRHRLAYEGLDVTAKLVPGTPVEKVLQELRERRPAMVVVGSHGHGALYTLLMGSVCESVLKHAECPVVVVPSRAVEHAQQAAGRESQQA